MAQNKNGNGNKFTAIKAEVRKTHTLNTRAVTTAKVARVASARVTFDAYEVGAIGKDGAWDTAKAYAESLGVSGGTVTGLRRLGRALSVGLDPESSEWDILSTKAGTKAVGEVLDREGKVTIKDVTDLAHSLMRDRDSEQTGNKSSRKAGKSASEKDGKGSEPVVVVLTPEQHIDAAMQHLRDGLPHLSDEALDDVLKVITRRVQSIRTARTKAANKAAKAA